MLKPSLTFDISLVNEFFLSTFDKNFNQHLCRKYIFFRRNLCRKYI